MLEIGMQGGPLHKKYKVYLDRVGVAKVPENYEDRLTEIFPKALDVAQLRQQIPQSMTVAGVFRPDQLRCRTRD